MNIFYINLFKLLVLNWFLLSYIKFLLYKNKYNHPINNINNHIIRQINTKKGTIYLIGETHIKLKKDFIYIDNFLKNKKVYCESIKEIEPSFIIKLICLFIDPFYTTFKNIEWILPKWLFPFSFSNITKINNPIWLENSEYPTELPKNVKYNLDVLTHNRNIRMVHNFINIWDENDAYILVGSAHVKGMESLLKTYLSMKGQI